MTEQIEAGEQPIGQMNTMSMSTGMTGNDVRETVPYAPTIEGRSHVPVAPQMSNGGCSCSGAGGMSQKGAGVISYVYAIGRVEARFPNLRRGKGIRPGDRTDGHRRKDRSADLPRRSVQRENRYLVRQLCWVLTIQGLETYLLPPRDPADIDLLVEAIRPAPTPQRYRCRHRPARPHRPAGNVQWTHGAHRRVRPNLFFQRATPSSRPSRSRETSGKTSSPRRPRNCSTGSCN